VARRLRAVCIHGHYYQPPREHPWLGVVEPEPSAAPDHDWNARIRRECYSPNAVARLLDGRGRLRGVVDNYAWSGFDVGPTLLTWLADADPALVASIVTADRASVARTGHGNAWAQAYNHTILPLTAPRDVVTQVRWGAREFELRFGRRPEGMWLPEMAVDLGALEAFAAEGIVLTLLAPHQARRVRPLGGDASSWRAVDAEALDTTRLYRCVLPSGAAVDVLFRHAAISQGFAFGELLRDGETLAKRFRAQLDGVEGDAIVCAATDGETFGHHHRFGEMAVAYAIDQLRATDGIAVTNPAAFRAEAPARDEVEIAERTSWSCAHGVERWRSDCGCRVGGPEWTQAWRKPLREAIDWLRDDLAAVFEAQGGAALRDPWGARDRYVDAIVEPASAEHVVGRELRAGVTARDLVTARRALEMARHALFMQTSCGWFFDDVAGVEGTLVLRQAGRALELARALGGGREGDFLDRLAAAKSNVPERGTAADVYRRAVQAHPVTPARIGATAVLLRRMGEEPALPGYALSLETSGEATDVGVEETRTGARESVRVTHGAGLSCDVQGTTYTVADLFVVQREQVLRRAALGAVRAVRRARREALAELLEAIDPLLADDLTLPPELAALLGYEEAERLVADVAAGGESPDALSARIERLRASDVVLPARLLAAELGKRLEMSVARLPDRVAEAHAILDVAAAAGVTLDLTDAGVTFVGRLGATPRPLDTDLARLGERLGLSPDALGPS
jgi:alpha-amylase/alpha-mannosidase (GH57 family)